jgi:hypothetical protein
MTCCKSLYWQKNHKCYLVYCRDKGCTESTVTWTLWQLGYSPFVTKVQQTQHLRRKTGELLRRREPPFRNTSMSTREQKSWSWISTRLTPGITALAKASSNSTYRPDDKHIVQKQEFSVTCCVLDTYARWRSQAYSWETSPCSQQTECYTRAMTARGSVAKDLIPHEAWRLDELISGKPPFIK